MRFLRCCAFLLLVLGSFSAFAQGTDVAIWGSWAQFDTQVIDPEFDVELEFEDGTGFGASANWFWGDHFSTELFGMALDADAEVTIGDLEAEATLGSIDLTPIMLTAQYHFSPDSMFDPYLGLGAAYVLIDDLASFEPLETETVEIEDELTFLANLGLSISFTPSFGINIDARYIPLEPDTQGADDPEKLELNPLIVSVGLRWRFGP